MDFPQQWTIKIQYLVSLRGLCGREGSPSVWTRPSPTHASAAATRYADDPQAQAVDEPQQQGCPIWGLAWSLPATVSSPASPVPACASSQPCLVFGFSPDCVCSTEPSARPHLSICLQSQSGSCFKSMMFTKLGRKAVSYFSSLPSSFLESPAVSLAPQAEMTGRLCSQIECQGLAHWLSG